jgi:transposase
MLDLENTNEHYAKLLGLSLPWMVESVKLDIKKGEVSIEVEYDVFTEVSCPECGVKCTLYDHAESRTWRHLDTMQFRTLLTAKIPRSNCKEHGVKTISAPWTEPYSRYTLLFTRFAIDVIKACRSLSDASRLLGLSWDELQLIQERAVNRGLARRKEEKIEYLGIDEKSFKKNLVFVSVLNDLDRGRVLDVELGKGKESANKLLNQLSGKTKHNVKAVAADMSGVFVEAVNESLPNADIVHDRFHISKYFNEALVTIWKSERNNNESLNKTKFLWIKNPENYTDKQRLAFKDIKINLFKIGKAWQIKEAFRLFWEQGNQKEASLYFTKWYFWATHSRLKPIIRVAKMLKRNFNNILSYFKHFITNATSEGLNSKIQQVKFNARGFRNFVHYRTAILFHCGKLSMYP